MGINLILTIAASIFAGVLVALVVVILTKNSREKDPETQYKRQLDAILNSTEEYDGEDEEEEEFKSSKFSLLSTWNKGWGEGLSQISGAFSKDDPKAGVTMMAVWLAVTALIAIFFNNAIAGAVLASIILTILFITLKGLAAKKQDSLRHQLTGFLFAIKANVSANETPERALMKVIDRMQEPLYSEILPAKNQILSNVGFSEAMTYLRENTSSEDLRFLCSCMIQATSTGVSLEEQIDIILNAVEQKRRTTEEITQATKSANMSMYGAGIIIPAGFIGIYLLDNNAREYWFVEPMSWAALGVAAAISFIGVRQARKFVSKVREL